MTSINTNIRELSEITSAGSNSWSITSAEIALLRKGCAAPETQLLLLSLLVPWDVTRLKNGEYSPASKGATAQGRAAAVQQETSEHECHKGAWSSAGLLLPQVYMNMSDLGTTWVPRPALIHLTSHLAQVSPCCRMGSRERNALKYFGEPFWGNG